jgi:hypothetical protein
MIQFDNEIEPHMTKPEWAVVILVLAAALVLIGTMATAV